MAKTWKSWREEFMLYVDLAMPEEEDAVKLKLFYYLIGESGRELCGTLMVADGRTFENVLAKFDEHYCPKANETVERYRFFVRNQESGEGIDKYVTELRMLAGTCNFGPVKESLIRDRIVCGTNSASMRERLLREENLTLEKCIQMCRASELSRENSKAIAGAEEVHALTHALTHASKKERVKDTIECRYCGKTHEWNKRKCPAFGKKCKKCGRDNHFATVCKSKQEMEKKGKHVHNVTTDQDSDDYEDVLCITTETVNAVGNEDKKDSQLFAHMLLGQQLVKFQLDCGASCNIVPFSLLNPDTQMEKTNQVLVMYNKSTLTPVGKCRIKLRNPRNRKLYRLEFMVVDEGSTVPLLGSKAVQAMSLVKVQYENILAVDSIVTEEKTSDSQWTKEQILKEYADTFTGDGCLEGAYKIEIDDQVEPVKLPKRRVPVALMKPLKEELADLQNRGIIAPVEQSTDWISSLVTVQKPNGKTRICIDPRPLNKALKRSHFPLPTIDDILPDLSKAKVFSVCDVKSGFWHVQLEDQSSYLTTFSTPFGRFRWLRMPMGISPAPEIFQRKLNQALEGLPGIYIIADDILITGEGETKEAARRDHDHNLRQFMERCKEKNIKLNVEKFRLREEEVPYIGHRLTADGLKVDPEKVRALKDMPQPTDVKGVQRLLGMVNYLSKFCNHLSDQCEILRQLTHKDNLWDWTETHEEAFRKIKETIANAPVLKYYNPEEELTLQCDASETGLGAALTQGGKPVAFASRALTQTEKGYAQIEKECLAIVFGMEKFHQYTYGRKTTVQSDHKPLENIVRKPLLAAPKRLQRMLLRLQRYDIDVVYVPGRYMWIADTLSRAYLPETTTAGSVAHETENINMVQYLHISEDRLNAIRSATKEDNTLQTLIKAIQNGWPQNKSEIPSEMMHYYAFQEELTVQDGIVFRGERAIIPGTLRGEITRRIHSAHLGTEGCIRRARECVYWQGMNEHIKTFITKCDTCRSLDTRQQKETLHPHEIPSRPWEKVGTDLFSFDNKDYLVTVDYFSNFWEVDYLPDTKACTVIRKLKSHFARQGIPDQVFSDNGPQFSSEEFQKFSQKWEFRHSTSSPGFPQSNGKAESAVKTAKCLMRKAKMAGEDPYLAMLDHRNTPTQGLNVSPAQRLLSRRTRTLLPTKTSLLQPEIKDTTQALIDNQQRQSAYFNRSARDLHTLNPGDGVRIQPVEPHAAWRRATVVRPVDHRSYLVRLDNGRVLRRNRRHLRLSRDTPVSSIPVAGETSATVTPEAALPGGSYAGGTQTVTTKAGRTVVRPQYLKDYD